MSQGPVIIILHEEHDREHTATRAHARGDIKEFMIL